MTSVLFVCLGNICRSPTAQAVFTKLSGDAGLTDMDIDSAGTGAWHKGDPPDTRSVEAAVARGYNFNGQAARRVESLDFARFEFNIAMDAKNLKALKKIAPKAWNGHLGLFMDFAGRAKTDVADPYYGGAQGFETVLNMTEAASRGLIAHINAQPKSG